MIGSIKAELKKTFPRAWNFARTTKILSQLIPRVYGFESRKCPICTYSGHFFAEIHFPDIFTYDAVCPKCGSLPRNRLLFLAVSEKNLLSSKARLLHFAPETSVTSFVRPRVELYSTADINGIGVDHTLNIEAIDQPDKSWDVIICSHVLEHVDHKKALPELYRILAPGGRLLVLIPIVEAWDGNYENPAVVTGPARALHFGKDNHVRRFGRNVRDDFVAAGFELETYSPIDSTVVEFGLIPGETLFIAKKANKGAR